MALFLPKLAFTQDKSSAVAEMGDRLATTGMGQVGRGCCGWLGPNWVPI